MLQSEKDAKTNPNSPFLLASPENVRNDILWLWLEIFTTRRQQGYAVAYYEPRIEILSQILLERCENA